MELVETAEEKLRRENEELRRQLQELRGSSHTPTSIGIPAKFWHPSRLTIWAICLAAVVLILIIAGWTVRAYGTVEWVKRTSGMNH